MGSDCVRRSVYRGIVQAFTYQTTIVQASTYHTTTRHMVTCTTLLLPSRLKDSEELVMLRVRDSSRGMEPLAPAGQKPTAATQPSDLTP